MLVEFAEVSLQDNKVIGPVFVNPRHVVRVLRAPTNPEEAVAISLIEDVNKRTTRVDGGPATTIATLNKGGR